MHVQHPLYDVLSRYTKALAVALGYRDMYTRIHSERVHALAVAMAERADLSAHERALVQISAAFHDIGKIGTPDRILLKPGALTDLEAAEMRKHSELGERIMTSIDLDGADEVGRVIRHHHENWDGTGYPDGLSGAAIPICSRIIGIADSYDAMAMSRAYHGARPHGEIVAILESESGRKHDPDLLRLFFEIIERSEFRRTS